MVIQLEPGKIEAVDIRLYVMHAGIEFVEEDKPLSAYSMLSSIVEAPNDPMLSQQWAMYQLGLFSGGTLHSASLQGRRIAASEAAWQRR